MDQLMQQIDEARQRLRAAFRAAAGKQAIQQGIQASLQDLADLEGQIDLGNELRTAANVSALTGILDKAIATIRNDIAGFLVEDLKALRNRVAGGPTLAGKTFPEVPGTAAPNATIPPTGGGAATPGGDGPAEILNGNAPVGGATEPPTNPDRSVISLSAPGLRRVNGPVVTALQLALTKNGQAVEPDGDFGGLTASALQRWQTANGFAVTNAVTEAQWIKLTGCSVPSVFDLCLGVTSDFEGTKFDRVVGNFDGQGLTFGLIGFTLVNGELKALLTRIESLSPGTVAQAFGALYPELISVLDLPSDQKVAWANTISLGLSRMEVAEPWKKAFLRIGSYPHARRAQMERARTIYWEASLRFLDRFMPAGKPRTDLDAALWYDISVQNSVGSDEAQLLKAAGAGALTGAALREAFAQTIANGSNPIWSGDVLKRKRTFVNGQGSVHGSDYNLAAWGLTDRPMTAEYLAAPSSIIDLVSAVASSWNDQTLAPDPEADEGPALEGTSSATVTATGASPHAAWALYDNFVSFVAGLGLKNITADELLFLGGQDGAGPCKGLNDYPPESLWPNIGPTAAIVDKLRSDLAIPVRLLSIYRSPAYNSCIQGSAANSQHMQYKAIDFVMDAGNPASWSARLKNYRASGMFKGGIGVYSTFVHIDTRGVNADWTGS